MSPRVRGAAGRLAASAALLVALVLASVSLSTATRAQVAGAQAAIREAARPRIANTQAADAQVGSPEVALSADTVAIGDAFELRVTLAVPPRSTVHFPDTLPATEALASLAAVRWEAEPEPGGGARLTLAYPLIAFRAGTVPVPGLDVLVGPPRPGGGAELPGGSTVGAWADAPAALTAAAPGELRRWRIARRGVQVAPPFTPAELAAGPVPRPATDVLGSNWHWPSLSLAVLFSAVLAGVLVATVRDERRARRRDAIRDGDEASGAAAALAALDRLLAEAPHRRGRPRELHLRASAIVRRYVESTDPAWGPELTATELMSLLAQTLRTAADVGGADEVLFAAMAAAEAAKFARPEPAPDAAEAHVHAMRKWIALRADASDGVRA